MELNLEKTRAEISRINDEMLQLFIKRMQLSRDVARYKIANGLPTYDAKREQAILDKVKENSPREFAPYAEKFFRTVMDLSKDYQNELRK